MFTNTMTFHRCIIFSLSRSFALGSIVRRNNYMLSANCPLSQLLFASSRGPRGRRPRTNEALASNMTVFRADCSLTPCEFERSKSVVIMRAHNNGGHSETPFIRRPFHVRKKQTLLTASKISVRNVGGRSRRRARECPCNFSPERNLLKLLHRYCSGDDAHLDTEAPKYLVPNIIFLTWCVEARLADAPGRFPPSCYYAT